MRPTLDTFNKLQLTKEQTDFDMRVAKEVMGWKELDSSLNDAFEKHTLPESEYPFFEILNSKGILHYHPTSYHSQMFSPSINVEDDIATLLFLLDEEGEKLSASLGMLRLIHHKRSLKDAGFQPIDDYYRISRYYQPGDFATIALHLIDRGIEAANLDASKITMELGKKYLNKYGISGITFHNNALKIQCKDSTFITDDVLKDFNSHGYPVKLDVR